MRSLLAILAVSALLPLGGCEGAAGGLLPEAPLGLGTLDASAADAGAPDAGAAQAGQPDAGAPDAGATAAGPPDAGAPDAGRPDAGAADTGRPDGGLDGGATDAGQTSARGVFGREALAAFDGLSQAQRQALSGTRVLFHHHSVGENLMGFWTDDTAAGGATQPGGAASLGFPFSRAASPSDYAPGSLRLGEASGGDNGDPAGKLASLRDFLSTRGFGAAVQVTIFKFCFIDFGGSSAVTTLAEVAALEATYRATLAELQAAAPALRVVHVTPPLNGYWNSDGNELRAEFGRFLRAEYGGTGFVFDLQDVESHDAAGAACARAGVPVACDAYLGGTGHLTDLGATRGAKALLYTTLQAATAP